MKNKYKFAKMTIMIDTILSTPFKINEPMTNVFEPINSLLPERFRSITMPSPYQFLPEEFTSITKADIIINNEPFILPIQSTEK